ncbi:hypothetical protein P5763_19340 [Bacillus cereus]|uniref:hypothetical protein n=1 Tax=Bacillus cereus TaxID=1396 RepID=UPI002406F1E9|nr:hypothetical protein [Bacillus cereus]MDF9614200.1 hypothetical protein [Bacillus cereus]
MTEYHFYNEIYKDKKEWERALKTDPFNKYNKYMIKEFFYKGRKFLFERHEYEVIENDEEVSKMKGWLFLKTGGNTLYMHPRKILFKQPDLKELLDKGLEELNIEVEMEYVQIELF